VALSVVASVTVVASVVGIDVGAGLVASVVLGVSFVVAGASKLAIGPVWPQQARDLGAPGWAIPVTPWIELVVGALLVTQVARVPVAVVAVAILVVFTGLLALRLSQGRRPPCACFGAWSASPIGPRHLLRNAVLIALGVVAILA
jgi:uncharacterized membrane protein YphA (DoxX/SURF4 family)